MGTRSVKQKRVIIWANVKKRKSLAKIHLTGNIISIAIDRSNQMNDPQDEDVVKSREIHFMPSHTDVDPAKTAQSLLYGIEGITDLHSPQQNILTLRYHLHFFTLESIEKALKDLGFHLDNSLLQKMKRALFQYTEEIQRETLDYDGNHQTTQEVFINRYRHLTHGCQDDRPEHWRNYW